MGELLRLLFDAVAYIWPFRLVYTGEEGGYYVCGKFWKKVGPGWPWPVLPWFMEVRKYPVVPAIYASKRLDLTLRDGTLLSCTVTATGQIFDFNLAINTVDSYSETVVELTSAVTARFLVLKGKADLAPEHWDSVTSELTRRLNAKSKKYGIKISGVVFTTFVFNPRVFRLMQDAGVGMEW